ncbi:MAG: DUF192 domain-containing protein [Chloroflexi bacterium]|nr:DUF192 domain-containing protein [Chloroflexota bacterium]
MLAASIARPFLLAVVVLGLMALPTRGRAQDAPGTCGTASAPYAEVQIDTLPRINLKLARTPPERERGLMFVDDLPPDSGMLFEYTAPSTESYWMYNTLIPLSIAFIDRNGTIVDIQDMARLNNPSDQAEAARFVYPSAAPYWYALEVNEGWYLQHGVGVGQQIMLCLGG